MSDKAPGMPVARSIKHGCPEMEIVAFGEPLDAGMYVSVDSSSVIEPFDIDAIVEISLRKGVSAIIPNTDDDVEAFSESKGVFDEHGIKLLIPKPNIVRLANDKLETYAYAKSNNVVMAETIRYSSNIDWEPPYFLKGDSRGVFHIRSKEEAFTISQYLGQMGERTIAQKYVDGEPYSVAGIVYNGNVLTLMIKKLKIAENGNTIFGVTVFDKHLINIVNDFVLNIGWKGPFEMEFIRNNGYHLIEINSRFPCWIDVGINAGLNLPAILAEILINDRFKNDKLYKTGIAFIKYIENIITDIDDIVSMDIVGDVEWKKSNI
ncbi:MAG: ATP-grasp domain-containing protein [Lutibacter sp.]|jgi:carbamoylphosphate synthase large subunit